MPWLRLVVGLATLLALTGGGARAQATAAATVQAYFLQGEQLVGLKREGTTIREAVTALLAGRSCRSCGDHEPRRLFPA